MKMNRSALPARALAWATFAAIQPLACVTQDVDPLPTGTAGSGGSGVVSANGGGTATATGGSSGGSGNSGGSGGFQSDPTFGVPIPCRPIQAALITDFTYAGAAPLADAGTDGGASDAGPVGPAAPPTDAVTFGDFTNTFSGGTFRYPQAPEAYPVASDVTMNNWHLSGSIGNYSGFGLYLTDCNQFDASAYGGISFSIVGNVAMGQTITLNVATASDDISHLWLNAQATPPSPLAAPNPGRCLPTDNQYDGSCATPAYQVPVTATKTTINVRWEDLTGGRPSNVNPAEITAIRWIPPVPTGAGTAAPTPYDMDIYIDDLSFIGGP
jgi:hypothetical protein